MSQSPPALSIDATLEYALYTLERLTVAAPYGVAEFRAELADHLAHKTELWWDRDSLSHDAYHLGRQATWEPIRSLEGLQHAARLRALAIEGSDVDSLQPLTGLGLDTLYLVDNKSLSDISPVATLTQLERLRLSKTAVTSLDALRALKRLRELEATQLPPLDEEAIEVLAELKQAGVKLKLDPQVSRRVENLLAARMSEGVSRGDDPILKELLALELVEAASLWQRGPHATDLDNKTCLHHLIEAPEEKVSRDALLRLARAMCERGCETHALSFPRYTVENSALTQALRRWPLNPALVEVLASYTTRWDIPIAKPPVSVALERSTRDSARDEIVAIVTRADEALTTPAAFVSACSKGELALVKRALKKGAAVNPHVYGSTPLFAAVEGDHIEVAKVLLESGADPNAMSADLYMSRPIHGCSSVRMVDLLYNYGADVAARDLYGQNAIVRCVRSFARGEDSKEDVIRQLIARGCPAREVSNNLMEWVCKSSDPDVVEQRSALLIEHGARLDPNRLEGYQYERENPLMRSTHVAVKDPFGLKLAKNDTHFKQLIKLYEQDKKSGKLVPGDLKWGVAIKLLHHAHRTIKGIDSFDWLRPKVDAALRSHASGEDEVLAQLLNLPASNRRRIAAMLWLRGPEASDDLGYSALDYLLMTRDPFQHDSNKVKQEDVLAQAEVALAMLGAGAKPGFDHFGKHSLTRAFTYDGIFSVVEHAALFDALHRPVASVQALTEIFSSALSARVDAAHQGWLCACALALSRSGACASYFIGRFCMHMSADTIAQLLKETDASANGNPLAKHDPSPLGAAAQRGAADVVALLLGAGADVEGVPGGESSSFSWPLGHASTPEVAQLLLDAGADPNARRPSLDGAVPSANHVVFNMLNSHEEGRDYPGVLEVLRQAGASLDMPSSYKPSARQMLEDYVKKDDPHQKAQRVKIGKWLATLPAPAP